MRQKKDCISVELDKDFVNKLMNEKWLIEDIQQCDKDQIFDLRDSEDKIDYEYMTYLCSRITTADSVLQLLNIIDMKQCSASI